MDLASCIGTATEPSEHRGGRTRGDFRRETLIDEPVDEGEQGPEAVLRRTDAVLSHQRRIETRDVRFHMSIFPS